MPLARRLPVAGLLLCLSFSPALLAQMTESSPNVGAPIAIKVHAPMGTPQILPPTLFGSFLEPIGHSTYGGLWADPVENPSFENDMYSAGKVVDMLKQHPEQRQASELGLPLPWRPLYPEQGNRYAPVRGDAANSDQSLLIMSNPDKDTGVAETVYLPVHRELSYHGSIYVKHVLGSAQLTVSLRRHMHPEQTFAIAMLTASPSQWTRYEYKLALQPDAVAPLEPVDLVIALHGDARAMVDSITLNPDDAIDGLDPDEVTLARELHTPVVRFGGNFTSAYNWQDGIGPLDKRPSLINLSWGIPEYNTFGTDEFLRFCQLIHAEPQIALNLGTGTPEQAAAWVTYVDQHWGTHQGGLLWELGNELWGDWQIGYPALSQIAQRTLATSQAVRAVDPHARLIGTGEDEDHFQEWNAQQLTSPDGTINYLSTHYVVGDQVELSKATPEFRTMAALALPWGLGPKMHAIADQAAAAGKPDVKVAFTEWLLISHDHSGPDYTNMGGALFAGGFLNMVMRNSDVVKVSDMTGIMEFGGIWKKRGQVYGAPAYWVLRTYASTKPHFLLSVANDSPTYSISKGVDRLPEITGTPYLDVIAAESEDRSKLLLFCVNRHLTRPLAATFDLSDFSVGVSASVSTLTAENILSENDEEAPERVSPVTRQETVGSQLSYTFPNASVTVLSIPLKH